MSFFFLHFSDYPFLSLSLKKMFTVKPTKSRAPYAASTRARSARAAASTTTTTTNKKRQSSAPKPLPKKVTVNVTVDLTESDSDSDDQYVAVQKRPASRRRERDDFYAYLDELDAADDSDDGDECHLPDDQVPPILRPEAVRREPDDPNDPFKFNPIIRDADKGAEIDAWLYANCTAKELDDALRTLSRRGANTVACMNWMDFEARQAARLRRLIGLPNPTLIQQNDYKALMNWFNDHAGSRMTANVHLRRHFAEVADGARA